MLRPITSGKNTPILPNRGTSLIIRENTRLQTGANIHASILRRVLRGTVYFRAIYYLPY